VYLLWFPSFHLLHDLLRPSETGNEVIVVTLSVQQLVLHSIISGPYDMCRTIVEEDEMLPILWSLVNGNNETSEVDAKCFLDKVPCPRQTIIEDSLSFVLHCSRSIIHCRNGNELSPITKCGMAVLCTSALGGGRPKVLFSSWSLNFD